MKRIITIISTLLLTSSVVFAQEADKKVGELLNTSNWFELERVYPIVKGDVQTPMLKLMAEVMLASSFNRPEELREKLQKLIDEHQEELGFENVCNMSITGALTEGFEGNYGVAADMVKAVADTVKSATGSLEGTGIEELLAYYEDVRDLPAPVLEKPDTDVKIQLTEKSGLLWIPVKINGKTYDFIFDTGASLSFISINLANEFGAKIISKPVFVGGSGGGGNLQRGLIEKMDVGPISFRNMLALVSNNPSADDPIKVDAVLGMDFIKRLGEIQIDMSDLYLTIPTHGTSLPEYGRNIIFEQNIPHIEATDSNGNKLKFILDTGHSGADLTDLWSSKNMEAISVLPTETQNTWGHGGIVQHKIVKVPECTLIIGEGSITFREISAAIPMEDSAAASYDGNLGMELLRRFSKITISFDEMFVKCE